MILKLNSTYKIDKNGINRFNCFCGRFNYIFGQCDYFNLNYALHSNDNGEDRGIRLFYGKNGNFDIIINPNFKPYIIYLINRNNFKIKHFVLFDDDKWHVVEIQEDKQWLTPKTEEIIIGEQVSDELMKQIVKEMEG